MGSYILYIWVALAPGASDGYWKDIGYYQDERSCRQAIRELNTPGKRLDLRCIRTSHTP